MTGHTHDHHGDPTGALDDDALLERVLGSIAAPALIFRAGDYTVLYANPRAERSLGFAAGSLRGLDLRSIVDYESGILPIQERRHLEGESSGEYEVRVDCPDGRPRRTWGSFQEIQYGGARSFLNVFTDVTEVREAEEAAYREARERETLAEIGRIITSAPNIADVIAGFSELVKELIPCEGVRIYAMDVVNGAVTNGYAYGLAAHDPGAHNHNDSPSHTLRERLAQSRTGIILNRLYSQDVLDRFPALEHLLDAGVNSVLGVPLVLGDRVIGSLHLVSSRQDAFTERHLRLAESVAVQVAGAVANDKYLHVAEEHARRQALLAEIGRDLSSSTNLEEAFQRSGSLVTSLLPVDRLAINAVDLERGTFTQRYEWGVDLPGHPPGIATPLPGTLTGEVVEKRKGLFLNSVAADGSDIVKRNPNLAHSVERGFRSFIAAPLIAGDSCVGSLQLRSRQYDAYDQEHLEMAEQIAAQVAGVIALAELNREQESQVREQAALAEIGRVISSSLEINEVFDRFAEEVMNLIPTDRVVISQVDHASGTVTESFRRGVKVFGDERGPTIPLAGSFTRKVIESGSTVCLQGEDVVERALDEAPGMGRLLEVGMRSFLSSPLISNDEVIGVLHLASMSSSAYTEADESLARQVASQIAGAVANSELYSQLSQRRQEDQIIAKLGQMLGEAPDIDARFGEFVTTLETLVPADRAEVALIDERRGVISRAYGAGRGQPTKHVNDETLLRDSLTDYVAAYGAAMAISRTDESLFERFPSMRYLLDTPYKSGVVAPLVSGEHPVGVLGVLSYDVDEYGQREVELVERVAAQIAGPIATAQLHTRQVQLLEEKGRTARLDAERRELRRINEARSQFLSTVSHELKTPLTGILAFMNLLEKERHGPLTKDQRRYVSVMQRNGRRLQRLIQDLLDVSRMGSGGLELEHTEFNFGQVVNDVAESFDPILRERQQDFTIEMPERPVWVKADRGRVYQIITNLVGNAAKYSPEKASIHARVIVVADSLRMEVTDDGAGMTEEDKARAFDMFFRADSEVTRATSGTGLGLAISQHIAALHGGYMGVESEPGQGSTFWFTLPGLLVSPPVESQAKS